MIVVGRCWFCSRALFYKTCYQRQDTIIVISYQNPYILFSMSRFVVDLWHLLLVRRFMKQGTGRESVSVT